MKEQFYFNLICTVYFILDAIVEAFIIPVRHKFVTNIKVIYTKILKMYSIQTTIVFLYIILTPTIPTV